ncbi:MAG: zinc ribbon domain-containing protein [Bryobacter sp.]|nr:zinc ribbon domain-containing protein [Bryobacter sp. CoA8 C33]
MPIYEYRCEKCGSGFEKLRPMREAEEPAECPRCGYVVTKKQWSTCCVATGSGGGAGAGGGCGAAGSRFT